MKKHQIIDMKTIGLLGGMSSEATREYYKLLNDGINDAMGEHNLAELILCSVNFQNIERFVRNGQWDDAGDYLAEKAQRIESAGADFMLLATNTMHKVRDSIRKAVSIPFLDIIEVTAEAIRAAGLKQIAILGTYPVMTDPFFKSAYADCGIALLAPAEEEKKEIDRIIFDEMCHHKFFPQSKDYYLSAVRNLAAQGAEGVILGCTEIKMLINQQDLPGIPFFDTTTLHCRKAVDLCLQLNDFPK